MVDIISNHSRNHSRHQDNRVVEHKFKKKHVRNGHTEFLLKITELLCFKIIREGLNQKGFAFNQILHFICILKMNI